MPFFCWCFGIRVVLKSPSDWHVLLETNATTAGHISNLRHKLVKVVALCNYLSQHFLIQMTSVLSNLALQILYITYVVCEVEQLLSNTQL